MSTRYERITRTGERAYWERKRDVFKACGADPSEAEYVLSLLRVAEDADAFLNAARLYEDGNEFTDSEFQDLARSVTAWKEGGE